MGELGEERGVFDEGVLIDVFSDEGSDGPGRGEGGLGGGLAEAETCVKNNYSFVISIASISTNRLIIYLTPARGDMHSEFCHPNSNPLVPNQSEKINFNEEFSLR